MNIEIVNACSDLGVSVVGSELGPLKLSGYLKTDARVSNVHLLGKPNVEKNLDKQNKKKNIDGINTFNTALYNKILEIKSHGNIPITIGGDHSISIATSLATLKNDGENLGLIWIDAFADYNTFDTSPTGNIHGMPLITVNGKNGKELTLFHEGRYYDPSKSVLIGARNFDHFEYSYLNEAGVTVFTTDDIKNKGIDSIVSKGLEIAGNNTTGMYVSIDISVIDPIECPAVSTLAQDGIERTVFFDILSKLLEYKQHIKGIDVTEYNPSRDKENQTYIIMVNILEKLITSFKS